MLERAVELKLDSMLHGLEERDHTFAWEAMISPLERRLQAKWATMLPGQISRAKLICDKCVWRRQADQVIV